MEIKTLYDQTREDLFALYKNEARQDFYLFLCEILYYIGCEEEFKKYLEGNIKIK